GRRILRTSGADLYPEFRRCLPDSPNQASIQTSATSGNFCLLPQVEVSREYLADLGLPGIPGRQKYRPGLHRHPVSQVPTMSVSDSKIPVRLQEQKVIP